MNGTRKIKSLKTIRMGDVLYDEQKRLMILCRGCERNFMTFQSFQNHLKDCSALKYILKPADKLTYDESKREKRLVNSRQELHIYDLEAVRNSNNASSAIDWEAELEDPRWYTDPKPTVQAIPKAKSKENIVKEFLVQLSDESPETEGVPAKRLRSHNTTRRPILTTQQQRRTRSSLSLPQNPTAKTKKDTILVPNVLDELKRLEASTKKEKNPLIEPEKSSRLPPSWTSQLPPQPPYQKPSPRLSEMQAPRRTSEQQAPSRTSEKPEPPIETKVTPLFEDSSIDGTQKILNKLRACGVEVKRGNTRMNPTPPNELSPVKNQQTLDIMRKLQSKGIRCTKVKKS
ncbi:uncharacterized protein LOC108106387 isoform X2 [Drosophila eugracilis]|uniref:uncharacterized protein LOC108106387 isoform X2 n=1 Tax=Drosophila eugracilis TaxID=29029 RepID=UPI0007E6DA95|nr:uncharacterized protein LOC108106387 isoform X2 [Drosophila eugracilis]